MHRFLHLIIVLLLTVMVGCGNRANSNNTGNANKNAGISIELQPKMITVAQGEKTQFTISIKRSGFDADVPLSFQNYPINVEIIGPSKTVGKGKTEATFTVHPDEEAETKSLNVKVTATYKSKVTKSAILQVTVVEGKKNKLKRRDAYRDKMMDRIKNVAKKLDELRKESLTYIKDPGKYFSSIGQLYSDLDSLRKNDLKTLGDAAANEWESMKKEIEQMVTALEDGTRKLSGD